MSESDEPKRNHASGSTWPRGQWEGADIEEIERMYMPSGQEVRVVSDTGGEKGSKLARFDLIPEDVMWLLAEHYGRGTRKYDDRNWERGYDWGLSYAALRRHLALFWNGEDVDPDPSLYEVGEEPSALHLTAVLWHAAALLAFYIRGIGEDSRPTS